MEKGVRLNLLNKCLLVLAIAVLASCTRPAPDLPPDLSSNAYQSRAEIAGFVSPKILSMTCLEMYEEMIRMAAHDVKLEQMIKRHRDHNQKVGYIGGFFPPALLAVEGNTSEKEKLDANQQKRDQMIITYRYKKCAGQKITKSRR